MIIQKIVFLAVVIVGVHESALLSAGQRPRSRSIVSDEGVGKAFSASAARSAAVARAAAVFAREYAAELAPPGPAEKAARDAAARQRLREGVADLLGMGSREPLVVVELTAPTDKEVVALEARIRALEKAVFDACQHGEKVLGDDRVTPLLNEWQARLEEGIAAQYYVVAFNRLKYRYMTMPPEIFIQVFPAFMREALPCEEEAEAENMHGAFIRFLDAIELVFMKIVAKKNEAVCFDNRWRALERALKTHDCDIRRDPRGIMDAVLPKLTFDEQRKLFFSQPIDACDQVALKPLKSALKKPAEALSPATLTDGPLRAAIIVSGSPQSPALSVGGGGPSSLASSSSSSSSPGRFCSGRSRRALDDDYAASSCVRSPEGAVVAARPAVGVLSHETIAAAIAAAVVADDRFEFSQKEVAAAFGRCSSPAAAAASPAGPEWTDTLGGLEDDLAEASGLGDGDESCYSGIDMLTGNCGAFAAEFDVRGLTRDDTPCPEYDYSDDSRADGCGSPSTHGSGDVAPGDAGEAVVAGNLCNTCGDAAAHTCDRCKTTYFCSFCFDIALPAHHVRCLRRP